METGDKRENPEPVCCRRYLAMVTYNLTDVIRHELDDPVAVQGIPRRSDPADILRVVVLDKCRETFLDGLDIVGLKNGIPVAVIIDHEGSNSFVGQTLAAIGSIAVVEYFRTDVFWKQVREMGVTSSIMLGAMTPFLLKVPPSPEVAKREACLD